MAPDGATSNSMVPSNQTAGQLKDGGVNSTPVLDFDFLTPESMVDGDNTPTTGPNTVLDNQNDDITDFFARPQVIKQVDWNLGEGRDAFVFRTLPWADWRNLPVVTNRMSNLSLFKGALEVRVTMTGNLTYAGALQVSYVPYMALNPYISAAALNLNAGALSILSQQSLSHQMDVSNPSDFVARIPLPTNLDYFDVTGEYENNGHGYNLGELGTLIVRPLNTLLTSSTATDPINLTITARLVDYDFSLPTTVDSKNLTAQSGKGDEVDQVKDGRISSRATVLANRLANFNSIPTIGPWTRATELAVRGVGGLASLMGYSRPDTENAPIFFKPMHSSNLASTTTPRAARVLSVDNKQQLSIDPNIMGAPSQDPLVLDSIARRKSFVTSFDWEPGASAEPFLYNFRVTPMNFMDNPGGSKQLSASAAAFLPFNYWRGTMVYEFQVVKNKFHMGKFAISYDPRYFKDADSPVSSLREATSLANSRVYNVSEIDTIRVVVKHGQPIGYLNVSTPGLTSETNIHSATRFNSLSSDEFNGTLGIFKVTNLTSADDTVPVRFNVFAYALDCQAAAPSNAMGFYSFHTQAGDGGSIGYAPLNGTEPHGILDYFEVNECNNNPHLNDVYFGETIRSLRPLTKRFMTHRQVRSNISVSNNEHALVAISLPLYGNLRGAIPGEMGFCNTTYARFFSMMFAAYRGSMVWQLVNLTSTKTTLKALSVWYDRDESDTSFITRTTVNTSTTDDAAKTVLPNPLVPRLSVGYSGKEHLALESQVAEVRIPHLSNKKAIIAKPVDIPNDDAGQGVPSVIFNVYGSMDQDDQYLLNASAGEDYQVFNFIGLPPIYLHLTPPL